MFETASLGQSESKLSLCSSLAVIKKPEHFGIGLVLQLTVDLGAEVFSSAGLKTEAEGSLGLCCRRMHRKNHRR